MLYVAGALWADPNLEEGERLLLENKPKEALPFLEKALNEDPTDEKTYLYLGIVHEQLQDTEKAIAVFRRGLDVATTVLDVLYFNIGNNYFRLGEYVTADEMYTQGIAKNADHSETYLNRANTRLMLENYRGALADYSMYLLLKPFNEQRGRVERMIEILSAIIQEEEQEKRQELERQRALMNEVLNSLRNASEDTRNLSAGAEEIEEAYDEVDIED